MEQSLTPGQIIILNGAPRSAKSSIVAEIQATFAGVWINLGVDLLMQATPLRFLPGIGLHPGGERPDMEPLVSLLYADLYESIAAHSRLGLNVVVDVCYHDVYSVPRGILGESARCLQGLPVLLVGVRCPLEIIVQRRYTTGYPSSTDAGAPPAIPLWQREVHRPGLYDLEVDTSALSPSACAEVIRQHLAHGPVPSTFQQLASRASTPD